MFNLRPTKLEVDLNAVSFNIKTLKTLVGNKTEIMAVVKANAYGHGAIEVSRVALKSGATKIAVATWEEGAELREAQIDAPILVLGFSSEDDAEPIIYYNLTAAVGDFETARKISQIARKYKKEVKVHINIDTGMSRLGIRASESLPIIRKIVKLPGIFVEGIFTHFTSSGEKNKEPTYRQFGLYMQIVSHLHKEGIHIPLRHVADSSALLDLPSTHLDMVRPGIAIYGEYPSKNVKNKVKLKPVSKLKTKIVSLRKLPSGSKIGYGGTYTVKKPSIIATIPVGYADGYSRALSNKGEVLVKGKRAPIVGRVCMDHCMIDVTHIKEVKLGEEVILWGKQGNERISLAEIAEKIGTIVYEIVTMIDKKRVPKVFVQH